MVADTSIKDQIKKLVDLQKIDEQIYNFNLELTEKPRLVEELKNEFESKKENLRKLEEKLKTMQVARIDKELELKICEENIAKANGKLSELKTNKEYTAKIAEIEHIKADKAIVEDKILYSYDETEKVNGLIEKEKQIVNKEEQDYLVKKKEVDIDVANIKSQVENLQAQRKEIVPQVETNILDKYQKILQRRDGLAIVPILGGSACGGCHMNLTAQMVNSIKMYDHYVACELCTRLLYLEDDL